MLFFIACTWDFYNRFSSPPLFQYVILKSRPLVASPASTKINSHSVSRLHAGSLYALPCLADLTFLSTPQHFIQSKYKGQSRSSRNIRQRLLNYLQSRTLAMEGTHSRSHTHTHTHTHTLASSILPLLEAPVEGGVINGCETCPPIEAHFQIRDQPKFTWSEIRRLQWLDDYRNVFSARSCCTTNDVWLGVLSWLGETTVLPLVAPFPPKCIAQPPLPKNLHV
jgi:hypothetical protein